MLFLGILLAVGSVVGVLRAASVVALTMLGVLIVMPIGVGLDAVMGDAVVMLIGGGSICTTGCILAYMRGPDFGRAREQLFAGINSA